MKIVRPLSLTQTLNTEISRFLEQETMVCPVTLEGLVELVSQLLYYKEEGRHLYPEIYIFDDINLIKKILPVSQFQTLGTGARQKNIMLKALKKCAPLTDNNWAIYILRQVESFEFGVFRAGTSILSVSISETLIDKGSTEVKAILIHQLAEKLIEIKGVNADTLLISYGNQIGVVDSPTKHQLSYIEKIVEGVDEKIKEQVSKFYQKIFLQVLQTGHGTLSCVISGRSKIIPEKLRDGIALSNKIDIAESINILLDKQDLQANANLEGQYSLILGMMQSDGITVFTNDGKVASYNVFIKHPTKITKMATHGGARSRTYLTLCDLIGKGIVSAYIQSQDGKIEFK
jgi:hypothetical protein